MHLSDHEIIEYQTKNGNSNEHLQQCEYCQNRLLNRSQFQTKLSQTYQSSQFEMKWDQLEQEFKANNHGRRQQKMESKIRKLQFGLIALAACFCLVVLIPVLNMGKHEPTLESVLAEVIDENNQLQLSLELSTPYGAFQSVAIQNLRIELQQIDREIQAGYLEGLAKSEKLELWQRRKELLTQSIKKLTAVPFENTKSI